MNIYKAEIIRCHGFNHYCYTNDTSVEETGFFSTMEKANEYLLNKGFMLSPVLILCGNKVVRVCKDRDEANNILMPSLTNPIILDFFHIEEHIIDKDKWILPCSIVNKELDLTRCVYANIEEIEVM